MTLNTNKIFIIIVLIIAFAGYATGYFINTFFTQQFLKGDVRSILLLYRPSYDFIYLRQKMNNRNDLVRIKAYYALFDYGKFDDSILIDRYKQENTAYIKGILVWMMGFAHGKSSIMRFLSEEYTTALPTVKIEMLRTLKRLDIDYYNAFIHERSIDNFILEAVN